MQEVKIDENTKGVLVYAKLKKPQPWFYNVIILVESLRYEANFLGGFEHWNIYRHAFIKDSGDSHVETTPGCYGNLDNYIFYKPTKEQRDKMKALLAKRGYKFDKQNNKMIRVKCKK